MPKPYPIPNYVPSAPEIKYVPGPSYSPAKYEEPKYEHHDYHHASYSEQSPVKTSLYGEEKKTKLREEKPTKAPAGKASPILDDDDYEDED